MAYQTLATADAILKDVYVGPMIEQLNYKTWMLDQIERDSDSVDFTGRRAIVPVHAARNRARGSIVDGGTLPVPGMETYDDAQVAIKYHAGGLSISDQAIKQTRNNDGAFVNLLERETKGLTQAMKKDINRQVYGDGTGLLASVVSVAGTAITVDSTQYLEVGDPIDILNRTTGAAVGVATITAINRTTKVVTVAYSSGTGGANTDGLYLQGSRNLEMDGLRNITGTTGTLHGIDRGVNEFWRGKRRDAAGAVAGESLFEQLADDVGAGGNGEVDVFITTRGIRRRLADTYQSQKRYNDARATEIHGGFSSIMVNEVPVIADDDAPKGWVFAINKDSFKWFEVAKPDWLRSEDGTVWQLATSTTGGGRRAAWEAWFVWYAALGNLAPNRNGAIVNAADDAA